MNTNEYELPYLKKAITSSPKGIFKNGFHCKKEQKKEAQIHWSYIYFAANKWSGRPQEVNLL